jgi:hypothetical protein
MTEDLAEHPARTAATSRPPPIAWVLELVDAPASFRGAHDSCRVTREPAISKFRAIITYGYSGGFSFVGRNQGKRRFAIVA